MASLGTTVLIALLLAVGTTAALCGFFAATMIRRKMRRTRRVFLVGVLCGLLAGDLFRARRRGLRALAAAGSRNGLRTLPAAIRRNFDLVTRVTSVKIGYTVAKAQYPLQVKERPWPPASRSLRRRCSPPRP